MQRINQLYSAFGSHFKIPFMEKYGMKQYTNHHEPVIFFGCYGNQIERAFENKNKVKIAWTGGDCWAFIHNQDYVKRMKSRPDIEHIAISHFIQSDLTSVGISSTLFPIVPNKNDDIEPHPGGEKIYAYKSAYNPPLFRRLKKELPQFEFVDARLHTFNRKELLKVYRESFIGLRFTLHDGCSNTCVEMGLSGKRVIHNGQMPNTIPFDLKNIEEIKKNILEEYENRNSNDYIDIYKDTKDYIDIGDSFLYFD